MPEHGQISITCDGAQAAAQIEKVQRQLDVLRGDTCQAEIGLYMDGAVGPTESFAGATGCTEPATLTLKSCCVHEHLRRKRLCAEHGQISPPNGKWFCGPCAQLGHDCPVTPELVPDPEPEADLIAEASECVFCGSTAGPFKNHCGTGDAVCADDAACLARRYREATNG